MKRYSYQQQVDRIKIQLNEQSASARPLSTSTMGGPDVGGAYEAAIRSVADPETRFGITDPEYQKRLERESNAYVGETEARKKIPGYNEHGRDGAARELQNRLDYAEIARLQRAGINRSEKEGNISSVVAMDKRNLTRQREEEEKSRKTTDRILKGVEVGGEVAGTVANIGLMFTPAAPYAVRNLAISAARLGQAGFAGTVATDLYKSAMYSDDKERSNEYKNRAASGAIGLAAGGAIEGGIRVSQALGAGKLAARVAKNIPGVDKTLQKVNKLSNSVAGGIGGGLAGTALGYSMVTPEDNLLTASAKVVGTGILGQVVGAKGLGAVERAAPRAAIPLRSMVASPRERATQLINQQLGKIANAQEPLISQGSYTLREKPVSTRRFSAQKASTIGQPVTRTVKIDGKEFEGRVFDASGKRVVSKRSDFHPDEVTPVGKRPKDKDLASLPRRELEVASDTPMGMWQPNPEAQSVGTGLTRKGAATQDYGYPPYPETHVGRADQELVRRVPWDGKGTPPPPSKKIEATVTDPNDPFMMWGVKGTKR